MGSASILGGINFIVTILRMRAPGMTMMRMPVFTWSILATSLLVILAAPVLTAGLVMVFADRQLGTVFFDPTRGGVVILWQHVFWFFGHPEVYMLILGAWGIVTEIIAVFSGKPIFSYRGVILSFMLITALSFSVWAHHMFATGAVELPFFSVTTELISIPTGVLFFIWLATLWSNSTEPFLNLDRSAARIRVADELQKLDLVTALRTRVAEPQVFRRRHDETARVCGQTKRTLAA